MRERGDWRQLWIDRFTCLNVGWYVCTFVCVRVYTEMIIYILTTLLNPLYIYLFVFVEFKSIENIISVISLLLVYSVYTLE